VLLTSPAIGRLARSSGSGSGSRARTARTFADVQPHPLSIHAYTRRAVVTVVVTVFITVVVARQLAGGRQLRLSRTSSGVGSGTKRSRAAEQSHDALSGRRHRHCCVGLSCARLLEALRQVDGRHRQHVVHTGVRLPLRAHDVHLPQHATHGQPLRTDHHPAGSDMWRARCSRQRNGHGPSFRLWYA
jgi:hypothetical protein